MGLEDQLGEEQKTGMIYYALKKLGPHILKDMQKIPEDQLKSGMRRIAEQVLEATSEGPDLKVVDGEA